MYLVVEYMKKGDLLNVLKNRESSASSSGNNLPTLSDYEIWNIFRQIAAGVRYLHYQNVIHGDIKPQVLSTRKKEYQPIKYFKTIYIYIFI